MGTASFKGNNGGVQRGRRYAIMLLLAFGAALLGVMALHKLREGRISNLLLKDKDHELFSLNLLLQRERDHNKEMKRKLEGAKEKMYALRTQKTELDSEVLEMQSTVGSLKDEIRAMQSALQEKDNELKLLHEKNMEASRKDPEVVSLREVLKLQEAEIEDLKQRLEKQVNIRSASSDDPSSLTWSSSTQGGEVQKDETSNVGVEEKGELVRGSSRTSLIMSKNEVLGGDVSSRSNEGSEYKLGSADKVEVTEMEKLQWRGESSDEHQELGQVASEGNGLEDRKIDIDGLQERKSETGEGMDTANESRSKGADEVSRNRNENVYAETINGKESLEKSGIGKGGMKLETSENFHSKESDYVDLGKQGNLHVSRKRGKKWRMLARNRRLQNRGDKKRRLIGDAKEIKLYASVRENQLESTGMSQQNNTHSKRDEFEQREEQERKEDHDQVKNKSFAAVSNEDRVNRGEESDKSQGNIDKDSKFSVANGSEKRPLKDEQEEINSGDSSIDGEVLTNSASQGKADGITNEDREHDNVEIRRQEDGGANAVLEITEGGTGGAGLAADKERVPGRPEEPRNSGDEESEESKSDGTGKNFSQEFDDSTSENKGNKYEYQAKANDSGF